MGTGKRDEEVVKRWQRIWQEALANTPRKMLKQHANKWKTVEKNGITKQVPCGWDHNVATESGKPTTLLVYLLGKEKMINSKGTRVTHQQHWREYAYRGSEPRDAEVRRKLILMAGPYGRVLAYQKLRELGLLHK